jgi:nucleosome binding factor SPN SPT16 subunit
MASASRASRDRLSVRSPFRPRCVENQLRLRTLTPPRNPQTDVLYKNIQHAFFQPGEGELIVLLHLHLRYPILVGKKKVKDVQFYTEVTEVASDLRDKKSYYYGDQDEFEEERVERERRRKHNLAYQTFVNQVSEIEGFVGLEFDIPYRELGFFGVPFKSNVFLQPTVHCLVNLTEAPFFVLTLDEVEIVHFERVSNTSNLRNFDMAVVFKDYHKPVLRISAIPVDSLEPIKEWLEFRPPRPDPPVPPPPPRSFLIVRCDLHSSINIKFSETSSSIAWPQVMARILEDLQAFYDIGGWGILDPQDYEEEESEEESEGSDFAPEQAASEEEESSDSEYSDASEKSSKSGSDEEDPEDEDTRTTKSSEGVTTRTRRRMATALRTGIPLTSVPQTVMLLLRRLRSRRQNR